ncbi:hypothetical protein GCM10029976_079240 [Kribbella albertanoniae]|uniref:Uncharacterized protein n=1 Tax=Kribbella albertanoniae TaxID=1266829 RepID=A0A4V2XS25_9ACTN|nr:hypothetical protein [Kribbella albertanoniae]TDC32165.1 hypothetical protein E1261_08995 [Kribbella albertanoniae]
MSQNPPEFTGSQRRRLNREYKRNVKQGTKDAKAAVTLKRSDRRRIDPAFREALGRSNLTAADLSAMMQRSVTGTQNAQARAELGALGQAAQQRIRAPRTETPSLSGMLGNAYSRWQDLRRGTKLLKAASTLAAKDMKTVDPVIRAQLGHSTMTRGDLSQLAQRNLVQAFRSPGDFEVRPGEQAPQLQAPAAPGMIQSRQDAARAPVQADPGRLDMLRNELRQLREQITLLEQQVAELEAAENQQQPEVDSPEVQQPEAQTAEGQQSEAQSPEAQTAEAQSPDVQAAEGQQQVQSTEGQSPEVQQPEAESASPEAQQAAAQSAEAQQHVGQHEAVPANKTEAQRWVASAAGENQQPAAQQPEVQQPGEQQSAEQPETQQSGEQQPATQQPVAQQAGPQQPAVQEVGAQQAGPQQAGGQQQPRGTAQPVFQAAGGQPTTRPGQAERPQVQQPTFQAAGEQPNEVARKEQAARAAAAAFYGTADVRPSTREEAAKTAQSDPNKKADRGTGQSAAQKNDPNGRGTR